MPSRTIKIVCALSILLNIFLIAGIAANLVFSRARQPMINAGAMRIAGAELPVNERRAFRQTLRAARKEGHALVVADRAARQDAANLLRAPVVDQGALALALGRVRDADMALRGHVEGRAIPFVAALPQPDREKLAEGMERRAAPRRR